MAKENRYDSIELIPPALPYDERLTIFDPTKRAVGGDYYNHYSGVIRKRPGAAQWSPLLTGYQPKKLWLYETLPQADGTQYSWMLMCAYKISTSKYTLLYKSVSSYSSVTAWTEFSAFREITTSGQVHDIVFSKGLAYVITYPTGSEKLGTIILDGSTGTIVQKPWGLLGPQTPARITGKITKLTADASATDTTLTVSSTTGFSSPIWIGTERITYTGTTATTFTGCTRGTNGTSAQKHAANSAVLYRNWSASDHIVNVNRGWQYSYAYVSITGQVSNRADIEANPDFMPSNTGPFFDLIPKVTYIVDSGFDSTNYPYVNMYRTTDGGGTFFLLEQIANAGPGTYTYTDDSLGTGASGTTYNDPLPDANLTDPATTLVSNSPPPRVVPPGVTGTSTPSTSIFSIETYASRIWYGISNYLFYSSRDELIAGVGEESFVSGDFGNFFVFSHPILGIRATSDSLYIITDKDVSRLTGTNKDTFNVVRISTIGGAAYKSTCTSYRDNVAFITQQNQLALISGDTVKIVSDEIPRQLELYAIDNVQYYRDRSYEFLIIGQNQKDESVSDSVGKWWIYDILASEKAGRNVWWSIWAVNTGVCGVFQTKYSNGSGIFASSWNAVGNASIISKLTINNSAYYWANNTKTTDDYVNSGGTVSTRNITPTITIYGLQNPPGNHLNAINVPMRDTKILGVLVMYLAYSPYFAAPSAAVYQDNLLSTSSITATPPPRIIYDLVGMDNTSYSYFPVDRNCNIASLTLSSTDGSLDWGIAGIIFTFDPQFAQS